MIITHFSDKNRKSGFDIKAILGEGEFKELNGEKHNIAVFPADMINIPTKATKTGARHSYAKYLLLPIKLRHLMQADLLDFENIKCGSVDYKNKVFVVFGLEKK